MMKKLKDLKVKIFADGADRSGMLEMYRNPLIKGFTTNPTLMRKAGISDYKGFAEEILRDITDRPLAFEVFADDFDEMERQALEIAEWAENVFVKIPITNTHREPSNDLVRKLARAGVKLNVTALLALDQVKSIAPCMKDGPGGYISVFAGRIADTGLDPVPIMAEAVAFLRAYPNIELIWASPRELLNIFHADSVGCHVITVTNDILKKLNLIGKNLNDYSLETVRMFYDDGRKAGYTLDLSVDRFKMAM
jgi:transaldolase